ncbi:MAG: serine hydrolase domain-containing protein [Bacteroidales bacterium]
MQPPAHAALVEADGSLRPDSSRATVPWWSFTKTLIAACALRLAEDGRLELDKLREGAPYTLRMLLQHRAGVGNYGDLPAYHQAVAAGGEPWTDDELFAHVPPDRPLFAPEAGWAYSNVGYLLVRRAVEQAGGAPLAELLRSLVLQPLGLERARLASGRADMADTVFPSGWGYHPGWAFHGIVVGPVAEAALALHRLLNGDLLCPRRLAEMLTRHPLGGALPDRPWLTTGYGLGLMMGTMQHPAGGPPIAVAGHSAGGAGSYGAVYREGGPQWGRTAAVFTAGENEYRAEFLAVAALAGI